ncbi:MAG TPA: energy-coupling factor transporter ATPase [Chloroflexi bacterium]|nr:energy-coupling factor transporter ATPase [Chloroflexota bacterium]
MDAGRPIIQVNDLHHRYLRGTPLEVVALKGVTMEIYEGEMVGIIGRSGAGKSTLVQHFNGLIRPRERGKVIVDGEDLADPDIDIRALRQKVGLVFQYPEQQLFERFVGDDIAFGPLKMGLPMEEVRERVREAMEMVGLDFGRFKDRYTFTLSGGEMRRAAIAGVLALRPKILILDESTSGVDPRSRKDLLGRIDALHRERGLTVIFVSSSMEDVAELVDRVYVIDDGRTVMSGTTREVFSRPEELIRYGLGVPQVTEIVHELARRGKIPFTTVVNVQEGKEVVWKILNSSAT